MCYEPAANFGCLFTCLFTPACVNLVQYTFQACKQENYQLSLLLKLTVLYFPSIERFTDNIYTIYRNFNEDSRDGLASVWLGIFNKGSGYQTRRITLKGGIRPLCKLWAIL